VKIADFGISKRIEDVLGGSFTLQGTPGFIAPELYHLVERGPDSALDIWALGEISFRLLTGKATFEGRALPNYTQDQTTFPHAQLRGHNVSDSAQDFLRSAMKPDPKQRVTAQGALEHPWMEKCNAVNLTPTILENYEDFPTMSEFSEELGTWTTQPDSDPQLQTIRSFHPTQARFSEQVSSGQSSQPADISPRDQQAKLRPTPGALPPSTNDEIQPARAEKELVSGRTVSQGRNQQSYILDELKETRLLHVLEVGRVRVSSVAFSPDGRTVACGDYGNGSPGSVRLWEVATGRQLRQLEVGRGGADGRVRVSSVAFSPDGRTVACGEYGVYGYDRSDGPGSVRLWEVATGRQLRQLEVGIGCVVVSSVAFSPDGRTVACGEYGDYGYDVYRSDGPGSVRLWRLEE